MSAKWYEAVKRNAGDVAAYIGLRKKAYLDRWNEALRFVQPGATVLDIGGGNAFPELLARLQEHRIDYWYLDVDAGVVSGSRALGQKHGFKPDQFRCGFNDKLDFADAKFDAIFSSHCIEHSFDLDSTFSELHRVLKPNGMLLMAVPFGWEHNPEHPYFFEAEHWQALVEDAGFEIRVAQIGREYPEHGYDLFIAARRSDSASPAKRVVVNRYRKGDMPFIPFNDPRIALSGTLASTDEYVILKDDWKIAIDATDFGSGVYVILYRHAWSGTACFASGSSMQYVDLYSWYDYMQPVFVPLDTNASRNVYVYPVGKNDISRGQEAVFVGLLAKNSIV